MDRRCVRPVSGASRSNASVAWESLGGGIRKNASRRSKQYRVDRHLVPSLTGHGDPALQGAYSVRLPLQPSGRVQISIHLTLASGLARPGRGLRSPSSGKRSDTGLLNPVIASGVGGYRLTRGRLSRSSKVSTDRGRGSKCSLCSAPCLSFRLRP